MSNKLLTLVGYEGITTGHTFSVNNLPFIHDDLLKAVAYKPEQTQDLLNYFNRIKNDTLINFNQEVIAYLSSNAKYSDTLLRFPEGRLTKGSEPVSLLAGQNIEQVYDIANVLQYGKFAAEKVLLYMQGPYHVRVSGRFDFQGMIKGENIFTTVVENNESDSDHNTILEIDLAGINPVNYIPLSEPRVINSKQEDQFVLEIQVYADCKIYPQTFVKIEPTINSMTTEFSVSGSFDQGFSDGFSTSKGLSLGTINPLMSLSNGTIDFDVDNFISKNAVSLAYCFANRVAVRLLVDKLTGKNLNWATNVDPETIDKQIELTQGVIKQHLKTLCSKLLFNIQTTATPPIVLDGTTGIEMGGFVSTTNDRSSYPYQDFANGSDEESYPRWGISI